MKYIYCQIFNKSADFLGFKNTYFFNIPHKQTNIMHWKLLFNINKENPNDQNYQECRMLPINYNNFRFTATCGSAWLFIQI